MRTIFKALTAAVVLFAACTKAKWETYEPPAVINTGEPDPDDPVELKGDTINLKIMSVGTLHNSTAMARFAEVIDSLDADFVVAREIDKNNTRSGITVNQADDLAKLAKMNYFFTKAQVYNSGEYGLVVLSKTEIEQTYTTIFPTNRPIGMITVTKDDKKVVFAGVQLDDGATAASATSRAAQATALLEVTKGITDPMIMAGNFYITSTKPANDATVVILNQQFTSACTDCEFTYPKTAPIVIADHIFYKVQNGVKVNVLKYEVLKTSPVDRLMVYSEIQIIL